MHKVADSIDVAVRCDETTHLASLQDLKLLKQPTNKRRMRIDRNYKSFVASDLFAFDKSHSGAIFYTHPQTWIRLSAGIGKD